jgi:hypothetical protein
MKSERAGWTKNPPPPALCVAHDLKLTGILDWHRTGLRTTAQRNISCQQVICNSRKPSGRWGGALAGEAVAGLLTKVHQNGHQNIIFEVMSGVQKRSGRRFCRNRYKKKYKVLYMFSCNLRSKSARSTLTSPGLIRVKEQVPFKFEK